MEDTFGNSTFNSGGGTQNIAQGTGAIGQQNNSTSTQQVPVDELLKLLAEIKAQLPELPAEAQAEVRNEVEGAELQVQKAEPNAAMIIAKLKAAQEVLKAVPGTVAAAGSVVSLVQQALKAIGM